MLPTSAALLLLCHVALVSTCPPQPNGNCYSGSYLLTNNQGGFQNQQCGVAVNRDWCAVSYQPVTQQANFGCAANFPIEVGGAVCGDGAGFVNQQGCSMVNTANGPCYFCCCKGGSCNHPQVFAREASKLPINQQTGLQQPYNPYGSRQNQNPNYYQIPWYNTASQQPSNPFFLAAVILVILLIFSASA